MTTNRMHDDVKAASGGSVTASAWVSIVDAAGQPRSREDAVNLVRKRLVVADNAIMPALLVLLSGDRYEVQRVDRKLMTLKPVR